MGKEGDLRDAGQLLLSYLFLAENQEEPQLGHSSLKPQLILPCLLPLHAAYRHCSVTSQWKKTTAKSGHSHCMTLTTVGKSPER